MEFRKEFIVCSAIYVDDGKEHVHQPKNIDTGYVIYGLGHAHCITTSYILNPEHKASDMSNSGFITSLHRYVDRKEAGVIAYNSGQMQKIKKELFSEDLIFAE